jgi:DNA-binding IclR family transcriptional regulator
MDGQTSDSGFAVTRHMQAGRATAPVEPGTGNLRKKSGARLSETISVKSADRVLNVLEALSGAPYSFSELSNELAIPRSSLSQLLRNLANRGYVTHDESASRYRLGDKVRDLVARAGPRQLSQVVAPHVEEACRALRETCAFYQRADDDARVVSTQSGNQALRYSMRLGDQAPLHAISAGRAILAALPAPAREAYLAGVRPVRFTEETVTDVGKIRALINEAIAVGFAYSVEEYTKGVVGIARAVVAGDRVIGAVNFAVPTARFGRQLELDAQRILARTAQAIALALVRDGW